MEKTIALGAEAKLILIDGIKIKKTRVKKNYRIPEIDEKLIRTRNKREIKVFEKLPIPHPKLLEKGKDYLIMEYIDGNVLKDVFDVKHCKKIGEYIAKMHDSNIIHGDLTTSNMIVQDNNISKKYEIFFIDFGLSFFSKKIEDRAVDLYLLYRAIESKHYSIAKNAFNEILKGYKKSIDFEITMKKFEEVKLRGKNKH